MHHWRAFFAEALLWLTFMTVFGVYAVRIAGLLFQQRRVERHYRYRLAASMGAALRQTPLDERSWPRGPAEKA